MRIRLREALSPDEMASMYPVPHNHRFWGDHIIRAEVTIAFAVSVAETICGIPRGAIVVDLSAGNGHIPRTIAFKLGGAALCGDYAKDSAYPIIGPIEETIGQLDAALGGRGRMADLFVCCETLEHLDDPEQVLRSIRPHANFLLISTPIGETLETTIPNPEHLWGWGTDDVNDMLRETGWRPIACTQLELRQSGYMYDYQIWMCVHDA